MLEQLAKFIDARFNGEEVKTLCFDQGLYDYTESKRANIVYLLKHTEKNKGNMQKLLKQILKERPAFQDQITQFWKALA